MDLRAKGSFVYYSAHGYAIYGGFRRFEKGSVRTFSMIKNGDIKVKVGNSYRLRDAPIAHADLEAGRTIGSVVLVP